MKLEDIQSRLTPLTVKDWRDLERSYKQTPINDAKAAAVGLTTDTQNTIFSIAAAQASQRNILSDEGLSWLLTLEGSSLLIYKTLHKSDPMLTLPVFEQQIEYDDLRPIVEYILEINKIIRKEDSPVPTEPAKTPAPSPSPASTTT